MKSIARHFAPAETRGCCAKCLDEVGRRLLLMDLLGILALAFAIAVDVSPKFIVKAVSDAKNLMQQGFNSTVSKVIDAQQTAQVACLSSKQTGRRFLEAFGSGQ